MNFLSLNLLIFSPLIAAAIIASPLFGSNALYIRRFSKTFASFHFLYSLLFVLNQKVSLEPLYSEFTLFGKNWIESFGIEAALGLDGFTSLLAAFTSFIFLIVLIISKSTVRYKHKLYYSLIFCLLTTTLGIFAAKDIFFFFMFWCAELIPLYLLIAEWGSDKSKESAMKYLIFASVGCVFILASAIGLYYYGFTANGELSSDIDFLRVYTSDEICPYILQLLMFFGLFIGFAIKLPIFPFHLWFTDAQTEAQTPVSILLSAVLIKTGAYGLIKFNLSLFPEIFTKFAPYLMIIALVNIIWASLAAYKQKNIKKIISYYSVAQMGIFLLGISALNKTGLDGAILLMFVHGLTVTGLYMVSSLIYQATKTYSILEVSGLGKIMPNLMICSYLICFSALGIPFTCGFPAEFLVYTGSVCADNGMIFKIVTAAAIGGMLLNTSFILHFFHSLFCGNLKIQNKNLNDMYGHKAIITIITVVCIITAGIFPDALMSVYSTISENLIEILRV